MKRWKKMLISLLLLVLVAAGYGFYLYYKKPPDVRKLDAQFTLNAADLVNEFNHDENAANKKYVACIPFCNCFTVLASPW